MSSGRFIGHRWLKPTAIALAFVAMAWYLLSGITVTPPENDETACCDDGYENASKEYDGKSIAALVDKLKSEGWVFGGYAVGPVVRV